MFAKRLISAVVLLAVAGITLILGGPYLLCLSVTASLIAIFELLRVDHMEKSVPGCISYISVIGFYLMLFLGKGSRIEFGVVAVVFLLLAAYVFTYPKHHVKDVSLCLLAVFYVGLLGSYLYQVRCLPYGSWFVWLVLIGASGSDTFAYLVGKFFGKHHFSELSPKKTIEGCIGGVAGAVILAVIYSFFLPEEAVQMFSFNIQADFAAIGVVCSIVSQIGDLAASAIKRNFETKDYGDVIPGHGGVLDRIDSILFVAPTVYYLLYWFIC